MYGSPHLIETEVRYRRQAAEQAAEQWRLAKMARRRYPAQHQARARLVELVNTAIHAFASGCPGPRSRRSKAADPRWPMVAEPSTGLTGNKGPVQRRAGPSSHRRVDLAL